MTTQQHAKKIAALFDPDPTGYVMDQIAAELEAYAQEAIRAHIGGPIQCHISDHLPRCEPCAKAKAEGRRDGLEEAAKLSEEFMMSDGDHGNEIAFEIRALITTEANEGEKRE